MLNHIGKKIGRWKISNGYGKRTKMDIGSFSITTSYNGIMKNEIYPRNNWIHQDSLSDLQGAWSLLRHQVVKEFGFECSDKLLFHIDEAMSWECLRDLDRMKSIILIIDNIAKQSNASDEIAERISNVRDNYDGAIKAIREGKAQ